MVLSACQTASGTTLGEGVFSLARAYMLAGTPAVLASLWKIDDNANAALVATFYEKLAAGAPPEIAIRNAKLDFLATPKPGKRHHPYYWAGMTMWR